jgi:hypothetical protein
MSLGRHATVLQAEIYAILACVYEIQMNALKALWAAKNNFAIGMAVPKGAE